jgi:hypothetical protein
LIRAYIAASRRSDRSLEARVESARRASEIHKRRTGRSLRVTEQDVINEEMYEEEDDDLPLQYRRLTAHLQTGSADFNRRLAAYLTNQVAMRSAMEQMVNNSYPGTYPMGAQFQHTPNPFQSPMLPQHHMPQSPLSPYRSAPYPSPHHPNFRSMHSRAYSMAAISNQSQETPSASDSSLEHRRMSTSAVAQPASTPINTDGLKADPDYMGQTQSATVPTGTFPPLWQDMGPFTTTLPPESQQMLGPALDYSDPFQAMLMNGSQMHTNSPYFPWNDMSQGIKGMPVHPSAYQGMSATLAPSALKPKTEPESSAPSPATPATASNKDTAAPSSGLDFNFSQESKDLELNNISSFGEGQTESAPGSGRATPTDGFWDNFVEEDHWNEETLN